MFTVKVIHEKPCTCARPCILVEDGGAGRYLTLDEAEQFHKVLAAKIKELRATTPTEEKGRAE